MYSVKKNLAFKPEQTFEDAYHEGKCSIDMFVSNFTKFNEKGMFLFLFLFLLWQLRSKKAPEEDPVPGCNMVCRQSVKKKAISLVVGGCACKSFSMKRKRIIEFVKRVSPSRSLSEEFLMWIEDSFLMSRSSSLPSRLLGLIQ
jgi:hypothetical protein